MNFLSELKSGMRENYWKMALYSKRKIRIAVTPRKKRRIKRTLERITSREPMKAPLICPAAMTSPGNNSTFPAREKNTSATILLLKLTHLV